MSESKVLNLFRTLGQSQGFYWRLYNKLLECKKSSNETDRENYQEYMAQFKDCTSDIDVILKVEC